LWICFLAIKKCVLKFLDQRVKSLHSFIIWF
jgi:hypothetical protein